MKNVYYVQRLLSAGDTSPFAFGGGKVNGGISPDAMKLLNKVFSFDYMGSAEFEWGAVPTAIKSLFTNPTTEKSEINVIGHQIYVISPAEITLDVHQWISEAAKQEPILKEYLGLKDVLEGRRFAKCKGWLKIEDDERCKEPFMFFVDKEMFENTCNLFSL